MASDLGSAYSVSVAAVLQPTRFDAGQEPSHDQWIPFVIHGEYEDGEPWEETFYGLTKAPGGVIDDIVRTQAVDDRGNTVWDRVSILRFYDAILADEDNTERFQQLVRDKRRIVELALLGRILFWYVEQVVERPTGQSSSSAPGPNRSQRRGSTRKPAGASA